MITLRIPQIDNLLAYLTTVKLLHNVDYAIVISNDTQILTCSDIRYENIISLAFSEFL